VLYHACVCLEQGKAKSDRPDRIPPPRPGEEIEGRIEDLAYGGWAVLRHAGWVVLIRGAFPGERVRVGLRRKRKGRFEGVLLEVLESSPDRIPPACPHLPVCGGCALQGLAHQAQARWKGNQAVELLRRIGAVTPRAVLPVWQSPFPWFYRNKMEFTFSRRPWVTREVLDSGAPLPTGPALGLHPRGRFDAVFDVTDCRLQSPLSNRIVAAMRTIAKRRNLSVYDSREDAGLLRHLVIRQAATSGDLLVILVVRSEHPDLAEIAAELQQAVPEITTVVASINLRRATVAQGDYEIPLIGPPFWRETLAGLQFQIGASSFFQTQAPGAEALIEQVLDWSGAAPGQRILDLYCGAGTFSLPLAQRCTELWGVEAVAGAVREAQENARRNGIGNVRFLCAPVEERGPQPWERTGWDLLLIDPPRSGLHPRARRRIIALAVPRLLYVSCNPATLARDAGELIGEGGYRAERLRVFDLFPQTPHLESVLLLERE